jgi:hypothetical protein
LKEGPAPVGLADTSLLTRAVVEFDLAVRVERALCATGYESLRAVRVCVRDGAVTLEGRVPSYHLKQVAQTTAQSVARAHPVCNDLVVIRPI